MKQTSMIKYFLILSAIIAILTLPTPFIWLEIGPMGKEYYGEDVPDIYILGATILGKDRSFWGISFAYKIQLMGILYFAISSVWTIKVIDRKMKALLLTVINSGLLISFPFWLDFYVKGVINNSDGAAADLRIQNMEGFYLYFVLIGLNAYVLINLLLKPVANIRG